MNKECCHEISSSSFRSSCVPWSSSSSWVPGAEASYRSPDVMCMNPYRQGVAEYGCGQCMPCRLNRRRLWTSRLMLESRLHESSFFITLTYDKEHLPRDGSVHVRDLQLFLKRLRRAIEPVRIRFYGVGEYGDSTERPHYHLVVFGLPFSVAGGHARAPCECVVCRAWGKGGVYLGFVTEQSAAYVAGYTVKKMTSEDDARLNGRAPEFCRMSLGRLDDADPRFRGGIGAGAVEVIADGARRGSEQFVPKVVRVSKSMWPLGRYLRRKVRRALGMAEHQRRSNIRGRMEVDEGALKLQGELSEPGAFQARDEKRVQVGRNALARWRIKRSKKGL